MDITKAIKKKCTVRLGIQVADNRYNLYVKNIETSESTAVDISDCVSEFIINTER